MLTYLSRCTIELLLLFILNILIRPQASSTLHNGSNPARIIGGTDAEGSGSGSTLYFKYPYVVAVVNVIGKKRKKKGMKDIVLYYEPVCTGSALTPSWTLIAAHCVFVPEKGKLIMKYGTPEDNYKKYAKIHGFSTHTSYKITESEETVFAVSNDIALAKTDPIILPQYGRISSIDIMSLIGREALALGFGYMDTTVDEESIVSFTMKLNKPLQALKVLIIRCSDNDIVLQSYPNICVAGKCGELVNMVGGDSGGPLLYESGIVGILSRAPELDYESMEIIREPIGYYTPTSSFLDWIGDTINKV